ncbi:MAG: Flp family type IVb pilin [Rhodospirillaceae bacterium]
MFIRIVAAHLGLLRDEKGATAIEYGLIAALIAVVIIGGLQLAGENLGGTFDGVAADLDTTP